MSAASDTFSAAPPRLPARCFFDVISPFAYLHFHALQPLRQRLDIEYVPVLFAGLLQHWGQLGPAEIPAKRRYIYRQVTWAARQRGLVFKVPPAHPFNPLPALRLIVALGAGEAVVREVFGFIFGEGRDIGDAAGLQALAARLGVDDAAALIHQPQVKQQLLDNTNAAIAAGVFGVPTVLCRGELFWGDDSLDLLRGFLDAPALFEEAEMRRIDGLPVGAVRRR
ncbi:MAG: 2-hydroxychromene-2-carboxylate isomerase [Nevskia sp.]|nr:2-hydroxychromene-2-carboxylate isomerase [Nevskia sp.]